MLFGYIEPVSYGIGVLIGVAGLLSWRLLRS
jgi:hypothetical protein